MGESGEIVELYRAVSGRLEEIVRRMVRRAPDPVVEDACQFAWDQLVHHRTRIRRETALAWLAMTAIREARRLVDHEQHFMSLDAVLELAGDAALRDESPSAAELSERRERIQAVSRLPERQRRLVWLYAVGLSYVEMATQTGSTTRTVERQLSRARRALREAAA